MATVSYSAPTPPPPPKTFHLALNAGEFDALHLCLGHTNTADARGRFDHDRIVEIYTAMSGAQLRAAKGV